MLPFLPLPFSAESCKSGDTANGAGVDVFRAAIAGWRQPINNLINNSSWLRLLAEMARYLLTGQVSHILLKGD
jgi:hypothetical protein